MMVMMVTTMMMAFYAKEENDLGRATLLTTVP